MTNSSVRDIDAYWVAGTATLAVLAAILVGAFG